MSTGLTYEVVVITLTREKSEDKYFIGVGFKRNRRRRQLLTTALVYANVSWQAFLNTEARVIPLKPKSDLVTLYYKLSHLRVKAKFRIFSSPLFFLYPSLSLDPFHPTSQASCLKPHALAALFLFYLLVKNALLPSTHIL